MLCLATTIYTQAMCGPFYDLVRSGYMSCLACRVGPEGISVCTDQNLPSWAVGPRWEHIVKR